MKIELLGVTHSGKTILSSFEATDTRGWNLLDHAQAAATHDALVTLCTTHLSKVPATHNAHINELVEHHEKQRDLHAAQAEALEARDVAVWN